MTLLYQRPGLIEIRLIRIEPEVPSVDDHFRGGDLTAGFPSWSSVPENESNRPIFHSFNEGHHAWVATHLSQYGLLSVALYKSLYSLITNGVSRTVRQEVSGSLQEFGILMKPRGSVLKNLLFLIPLTCPILFTADLLMVVSELSKMTFRLLVLDPVCPVVAYLESWGQPFRRRRSRSGRSKLGPAWHSK